MMLSTRSNPDTRVYNPFLDLNEDGTVDIFDAIVLANGFGTSGTPVNKTALLLELESIQTGMARLVVETTSGRASIEFNGLSIRDVYNYTAVLFGPYTGEGSAEFYPTMTQNRVNVVQRPPSSGPIDTGLIPFEMLFNAFIGNQSASVILYATNFADVETYTSVELYNSNGTLIGHVNATVLPNSGAVETFYIDASDLT
jgi:hypothetical protein